MTDQSASPFVEQSLMANPLRALLLDDSKFDRARIRRLSHQSDLNIQLDEVDTLSDMKSAAEDIQYDLFLIDYRLPVGDGVTAMQMLREDPRHNAAGNILITGDPALSTTVSAMRSGYHDVLSKDDMTAPQLKAAIHTAMAQARGPHRDDQRVTRDDVAHGIRSAVTDPEFRIYLRNMLTGLLAPEVLLPASKYNPVLDGFLDADEFVFRENTAPRTVGHKHQ